MDPRIPRDLETSVLKALAKDPGRRYASAEEMAEDLRRFLADRPILARRTPWRERAWRWCRRNPTLSGFSALTLLLLMIVACSLLLWQRKARENIANLRSATEAGEEMALTEIRFGRFESAEKVLQSAVQGLGEQPELQDLASRLEARRDRVHRLARFYHLADEVQRLALNERLREALAAGEEALAHLEILAHEDWWAYLPEAELTASQRDQLRQEACRQLMFVAGLRALAGFRKMGTHESQANLRSSLDFLSRAERFQPSRSGNFLKLCCLFGMGRVDQLAAPPVGEPTSTVDFFFLGLIHLAIPTNSRHPVAEVVRAGPEDLVRGLDFKTPLATAAKYLQTAARLQPAHAFNYLFLAHVLYVDGQPHAAELAANTFVVLEPRDSIGYQIRAEIIHAQIAREQDPRRKRDLVQRAIGDATEAIRLRPESAPAYWTRGRIYRAEGKFDETIADLNEAIRLSQREYDQAKAVAKEPLGPDFSLANQYIQRGNALLAKKEYAAAIADYDRGIAILAIFAAFESRAFCHKMMGDYDQIINDYTELIQHYPQDARAYRLRAEAYSGQRQWERAAADLTRAIELAKRTKLQEPDDSHIWFEHACLRLLVNDLEGYRQTCARMLELKHLRPFLVARACTLAPGAVADLDRVALLAKEELDANRTGFWSLAEQGALAYRRGRLAQAREPLSASLKVEPNWSAKALSWLWLAMIEHRVGKTDQAKQWLARAEKWLDAYPQGIPPGLHLHDWLESHILRREAAALVFGQGIGGHE